MAAELTVKQRRRRRWTVRIVAGLATVVLVGGAVAVVRQGDDEGDPEAAARVAAAPAAARARGTARLTYRSSIAGATVDVDTGGQGLVDLRTNAVRLSLAVFGVPFELVSSGREVFVVVPEAQRNATGGKPWMRVPAASGGSAIAAATSTAVIDALAVRGNEVDERGEEEVNGVATTRYEVLVRSGDDPGTSAPFDVWLDDAGLPVRIEATIEAGGGRSVVTFDLSEFGVAGDVTVPPPADVFVTEDPGLLRRLFGLT